jgi:hypothetical protein
METKQMNRKMKRRLKQLLLVEIKKSIWPRRKRNRPKQTKRKKKQPKLRKKRRRRPRRNNLRLKN